MQAVYDHRQHRLFTNALSCLSRFGDKVNLRCARPEESDFAMRLTAINPAGSAYCAFLLSPDFFLAYALDGERRRVDLLLHIRALQNVLKVQLNRKLEKCELRLIETDGESRLAVRLHSFNGVTKTHKLTYEEKRGPFPTPPREGSEVTIEAKTIHRLLEHFGSRSHGEISLVCRKDDMTIKSRADDFVDQHARKGRPVSTEVKVDQRSFRSYRVEADVELTFALREFKAAIALADHLSLPLVLRFSRTGEPLIITVRCPSMTAQIFIATSAPSAEETSQSTAAENVSQPQSMSTDPRNPTAIQGEPLPAEGASEMVFSGRSAGSRAGPLQSTAPTAPPVQSGRSAVNHGGPLQSTPPIERRVLEEEDQPLFFGDSSPREHDLQLESHTLLQDTMDEVNGRPTTQSASQVLADMAIEIPLAGEEEEKEDSDGEFPPSDDELPSTQQETSSKRAKYISLF